MLGIQFDVECVVSYFMAFWHHIYFCLSSNFVPSIITKSDFYSSLPWLMSKSQKYQLHRILTVFNLMSNRYVVSYYVPSNFVRYLFISPTDTITYMLFSQYLKPCYLFLGEAVRNELVLRVQPSEAVYVKVMTKTFGMSFSSVSSKLKLMPGVLVIS